MRRCSARPYEGKDSYIFVSYCHRDRADVFPVIEQLARDGYRVWYDEGIDPGSEWPEIIAGHLNGCAACIAFISGKSLDSHNCRREINFALLKRKPFISVVIEETEMSLGMQMQLSATQSIFRYTLSSDLDFFQKLYDAKFLEQCKGEPDLSITVSRPEDYRGSAEGMFSEHVSEEAGKSFSDRWFLGEGAPAQTGSGEQPKKKEEAGAAKSPEVKTDVGAKAQPEAGAEPKVEAEAKAGAEPKAEAQPEAGAEPKVEAEAKAEAEPKAEAQPEAKVQPEEKLKQEEEQKSEKSMRLIYEKTGEKIPIGEGELKLGRSSAQSDYVISGNSGIGRLHAKIIRRGNECFVLDNHSLNKTYLNGKALEPDREYALADGDSVRLLNEKFSVQIR